MGKAMIGVLVLACLGFAGCGDEVGQCETAARLMCDKACECGGSACRVASIGDGGASAGSFNFDDRGACLDFFLGLGCAGGGSPDIDYGACGAALSTAMCVSAGGEDALASPPACGTQ